MHIFVIACFIAIGLAWAAFVILLGIGVVQTSKEEGGLPQVLKNNREGW